MYRMHIHDGWATHKPGVVLRQALHMKGYFGAALSLSIGGFLNGYDTGSIGAITEMPQFKADIVNLTPTLRGLTVSLLLLAGVIPSLFAGLLADKFGHLVIVLLGALCFTIGAALEAGAVDFAMLLVGRTLVGIGEGLYLGNMNVYICEIAPKKRRGMLVAMPQLLVTAGICAGYFTCYGTIHLEHSSFSWRIPFILQAAGGAILVVLCGVLPQSPRWLLVKAKPQAAARNKEKLDMKDPELDDAVAVVAQGLSVEGMEGDVVPSQSIGWATVMNMFRGEQRFPTILALFILGMVQLCGIDGVLYYAPTLFAQAGLSKDTASFVASGVSAILMFAVSVPAFLMVDRFGRRTIVIVGGCALAGTMVVIGSLYASDSVLADRGSGRWIVIVCIFLYAISYVSTWGIVGKIYASEIQQPQSRATANSLAQALNFLTNFLVAFITPIFLAHSSFGPYYLFAGLTITTLIVLWFWMPETRGRSLESIRTDFTPPIDEAWARLRSMWRTSSPDFT